MGLLEKPDRQRGYNKERIIRVLLNHAGDDLTKYRAAKLAEVSEPWTRQYSDRLEDQGLIKDTQVLKPRELYEEWREIRIPTNQVTVSMQAPMQLLEETELEYGLTTYRAENLHQGVLFPSTTDFYINPEETAEWTQVVKDKGLLGGGNTRIRVADSHVFYHQLKIEAFTTVSIPQLILDLLDEGGPCEEAAETLIQTFHSG